MNIIKYKKIGKDKYKVYFENQELTLYEDVILKYNLISKKNIDIELLENVLESNKYYEMYNLALNYISFKMHSESEIRDYLIKKDASNEIIDRIIKEFYSKNILNDELYIKSYINDSVNLKDIGPLKIKNELIKKGFNEELISEYLNTFKDDIWEDKIRKQIKKYLSNKRLSTNMIKLKILNDLNIKGYSKEMIYPLLENISLDDEDNIKEEYKKAYKKYSSKFKDKELDTKISNYLIRKGYNYSDINRILN